MPINVLGRVGREEPDLSTFSDHAVREYVRCFADPAAIHARCEDCCAAATIDLEHDRSDRDAGRKPQMPCGHFIPEQAPQETLAEIGMFLCMHPLETK